MLNDFIFDSSGMKHARRVDPQRNNTENTFPMKTNNILIIISFISICILYSCQNTGDKKESKYLKEYDNPTLKNFEINEVLKPLDIALNDNFLCVLSEENGEDGQIFVFDADNLDFLFKFARKGTGPEETLALDMVKTLRGDTIDLIDQANYRMLSYILSKHGADLIKTKHLDIPSMGPLQETYWINDSVLIFNTTNGDLITYNDNNDKIIDRINISSLIEGLDENDVNNFGKFNFAILDKEVVIGLRSINELFKMRLDDEFHFIMPTDKTISVKDINLDDHYDNYGYYSFVNSGKEYILAQYYGFKMKNLQPSLLNPSRRYLKYDLLLFDPDLNLLRKYRVDTDILRIFLDEKRKRIYYLEAFEDFDHLRYIEF